MHSCFGPSAERKKNNNRYFDKKVKIRLPVKCTIQGAQISIQVFQKCYIGGNSTNIGKSKRVPEPCQLQVCVCETLYSWNNHQYSKFMKCVEQNGAFRKDNNGVIGHLKYCIIEPTAVVTVVDS